MNAATLAALVGLGWLLTRPTRATRPSAPERPNAPQSAGCPPPGTRVLLIGDSLAVGLKISLAERAQRCPGVDFVGRAFVGAHVTQWDGRAPRLKLALDANRPTHVLISLGGNDMGRNDPEEVRASVQRLVGELRDRGVVPLWIDPPEFPFPDAIGVRSMWRAAIARPSSIFDARAIALPRAADGIHPTAAGYEMLATALWAWLAQLS